MIFEERLSLLKDTKNVLEKGILKVKEMSETLCLNQERRMTDAFERQTVSDVADTIDAMERLIFDLQQAIEYHEVKF